MSLNIQTNALTTVSIAVGPPALNDATSFNAKTYTLIGEVLTLTEYGVTYGVNVVNVLGSRRSKKLKNTANDGTQTIGLARDIADAGQVLLLDAADGTQVDTVHCLKIVYGNGDIEFSQGKVTSYSRTPGDANATVASTAIFELENKIVDA